MPKLLLFLQDDTAREVPLDKDRITIGRRSDNDVPLPFPSVSGRHAVISCLSAEKYFVEDLKSTNGTLLNGAPIYERKQLKDRDQVDVGGQKFVFLEGMKTDRDERRRKKSRVHGSSKDSLSLVPDAAVAVPPPAPAQTPALAPAHEYLNMRPTIPTPPGIPATPPAEEHIEEEEIASGLHFPTIIKTSSSAPPRPPARKEPAPLPALDADLVPPPSPTQAFAGTTPPTPPPQPLEEPTYRLPPIVAVLTAVAGPNEQRRLPLRHGEYILGRPGFQLAVIRVSDEGCRLLPMAGEPPIELRGQTIPAEGMLLADHDTFTVGRSPLQFAMGAPDMNEAGSAAG